MLVMCQVISEELHNEIFMEGYELGKKQALENNSLKVLEHVNEMVKTGAGLYEVQMYLYDNWSVLLRASSR